MYIDADESKDILLRYRHQELAEDWSPVRNSYSPQHFVQDTSSAMAPSACNQALLGDYRA